MTDTVKIKLYVGTGFANCKHEDIFEIDREHWESMSSEEQENLLDELAVDFRNNVIECTAWVMEEGED
jgi:hypothetical protein